MYINTLSYWEDIFTAYYMEHIFWVVKCYLVSDLWNRNFS